MTYEGAIYRPPSESKSLLVQITVGCSHNGCTFCSMYKDKKFRIRKVPEILKDLQEAAEQYQQYVERIFLCDGDALVMKTDQLIEILTAIKKLFPLCKRVGIYATPRNILHKRVEELKQLEENGLGIFYLGLESGSGEVLKRTNKGATPEEMIEAAKRVHETGIKLSVMVIAGLGGQELFHEHAEETAEVLNQMQPHYLGLLSLLVDEQTALYQDIKSGSFQPLTPEQIIIEMYILLNKLQLNDCLFTSAHASNYIVLKGELPEDKERLLKEIHYYMENKDLFRHEFMRRF